MKGPETEKIQSLFDSIAKDYDKLNHILSLGVDKTWRRRALKFIVDGGALGVGQTGDMLEARQESTQNGQQQAGQEWKVLDIACGTGDFSIEIAKHSGPGTTVTGLDLSEGMLAVMRKKVAAEGLDARISAEQGNSERMRFAEGSFDRATIAFGIRNFEHREEALQEILRVLKPGGRLVILELSVPSNAVLRWLYCLYFTKILPWFGGLVSGDKAAYRYLPASVLKFPGKEEWMATMSACGYRNVTHKSFTFGICRMYTGEK